MFNHIRITNFFGYQTLETFTKLGSNFILSIFFARAFGPEILGLYAFAFFYYSLLITIGESGLSQIAIKATNVGPTYYKNILKILACIFLIISLLFYGLSSFLNNDLGFILYIIPIISFFEIFSCVPKIKMYRDFNFKKLFQCTLLSEFMSAFIVFYLYVNKYDISGLSYMILYLGLKQGLLFILLYTFTDFKLIFKENKILSEKVDLPSSFKILGMSLLDSFYRNVYPVILGYTGYSNNNIGIYSRVDNLGKVSTSLIATVFQKVSYPIFSKINYKEKYYQNLIIFFMATVTNLSILSSVILMLFSHDIVVLIYGNAFYDVGTYIKPILFMTVLFPINAILINEYILSGNFKGLYYSELIRKIFGFIVLLIAAYYSLDLFVWTIGFWGVISTFINIYFLAERIKFIKYKIYFNLIRSLLILVICYIITNIFYLLNLKYFLFTFVLIYIIIHSFKIYDSFRKISS